MNILITPLVSGRWLSLEGRCRLGTFFRHRYGAPAGHLHLPLLSPQLKDLLLRKYREERTHVPEDPLTKREKEILRHIAEGKSSREIGALLEISSRTVEHHRANMMRKVGLPQNRRISPVRPPEGYTSDQVFPLAK